MNKKVDLSSGFHVEYFHLSNHQSSKIEALIILVYVDGCINAEYEVKIANEEFDDYIGDFATREEAIIATEQKINELIMQFRSK